MPNLLSKIFTDIKSAANVQIPPAFHPLAYLLLPNNYKSNIEQLVDSAPLNFSVENSREWWKQLMITVGATKEDVGNVYKNTMKLTEETKTKVEEKINKLSEDPAISADRNTAKMVAALAKLYQSDVDLRQVYEKQQILAKRIQEIINKQTNADNRKQRVDKSINKRPATGATKTGVSKDGSGVNSAPPGEIKAEESLLDQDDLITEGAAGALVPLMARMFGSAALTKLMMSDAIPKKDAQRLARSIIYNVLLNINERLYKRLEAEGMRRQLLSRLYRHRNKPENRQLIIKAARILGSKKFGNEQAVAKKAATKKTAAPQATQGGAEVKPSRWKTGPAVTKRSVAKKTNEDGLEPEDGEEPIIDTGRGKVKTANPDDGSTGLVKEEPKETPQRPTKVTPGTIIYREMMAAAKSSENPTEAAEAILFKYEEMGIPEAAIVRRMWERSAFYRG
jgi:hypothetical protein